MKNTTSLFLLIISATLLWSANAAAAADEQILIKLKTDDFALDETDVSHLEPGEAETITTDSGKVIDLLRTTEAVEIYVDGELLELPHMSGHDRHQDGASKKHHRIIIECEVVEGEALDSQCADELVLLSDGEIDIDSLHGEGDHHKVLIKRIHHSDDGELHEKSEVEKVIIIEKD